jgi:hypothetical protein
VPTAPAMERRCDWRRPPDCGGLGQMVGHGSKFGRKKEEAIAALLTQRTTEDAARAAGVGPATLLRWLKEPDFDAAYREARRAAFGQSIARLHQASGAAVSTLLKIMVDASLPASSRVRAAENVLEKAAHAIEIEQIEMRLARLERLQQESDRRDAGAC